MGLCKCPKKKVTNLFCFEHRVNVCEHCLIESHSKCVVQSYLSWLADSDYDPNCSFCSKPLADNDVIRLKCLHLFHWACFDAWARSLPANTAPAGYKCPLCSEAVFPPVNQTSPTIDALRDKLKDCSWARAGLGLPLLPGRESDTTVKNIYAPNNATAVLPEPVIHLPEQENPNFRDGATPTIVDFNDIYTQRVRKLPEAIMTANSSSDNGNLLSGSINQDEDLPENKYKRRLPKEWLGRWMRSRYGQKPLFDPYMRCKRVLFILITVILITVTFFTILLRIIGTPADDDPAFDPLANPNVRIAAVHDDAQ